jgi:hypothetical protein
VERRHNSDNTPSYSHKGTGDANVPRNLWASPAGGVIHTLWISQILLTRANNIQFLNTYTHEAAQRLRGTSASPASPGGLPHVNLLRAGRS